MLDDGDPFDRWEMPVVATHISTEINGPVGIAIDGGAGCSPLAMAGRAILLVPDFSGGGVRLLKLVLRTNHPRRNPGRNQRHRQAEHASAEPRHCTPRTCLVHETPVLLHRSGAPVRVA